MNEEMITDKQLAYAADLKTTLEKISPEWLNDVPSGRAYNFPHLADLRRMLTADEYADFNAKRQALIAIRDETPEAEWAPMMPALIAETVTAKAHKLAAVDLTTLTKTEASAWITAAKNI